MVQDKVDVVEAKPLFFAELLPKADWKEPGPLIPQSLEVMEDEIADKVKEVDEVPWVLEVSPTCMVELDSFDPEEDQLGEETHVELESIGSVE